jgi:hypothetical protein
MTPQTFTVESILRASSERRARGLRHEETAHAAVFDHHDIRIVERDGTEYVGRPIIEPGAWESIGVITSDGIEWFHAAALAEVEAVPT